MDLKQIRSRRQMTQQALAEASGLSQSHIALLESGQRGFSLPSLNRIARALKVSPKSLLPKD